ncbi:MAG: hypothetical protein GY810_15005 [Aureispira sp.]|nr:hypothetical protein [Aureispira sp.]
MIKYQNYDCTLENVVEKLQTDGIAVLPNILSPTEVEATQQGMWDMLEYVSKEWENPIKKDVPESWNGFYQLLPFHSMMIQSFGLSHSQYIWNIRQNEKVVEAFAKIWNCSKEELITSFDGLSIHLPPETTGKGWFKELKWLHVDQSYLQNDFECAQGFVSAWDIEEGDASFTFLDNSHRYHKEFKNRFDAQKTSDWHRLNEEELKFYADKGCENKAVKCSAGSLVLWDSRLVYSGMAAHKERKNPKIRHVIYVCQTERKRCSKDILQKRINAFENMETTNHWPHKATIFEKDRHSKNKELPVLQPIPTPVLSDLGEKLVGY